MFRGRVLAGLLRRLRRRGSALWRHPTRHLPGDRSCGIRKTRDLRADLDGLPLGDNDLAEHSFDVGFVSDRRLVGFDLDDRLAARDRVPWLLQPADDSALRHRVGETRHHDVTHLIHHRILLSQAAACGGSYLGKTFIHQTRSPA
jgi:hypothetical protein